MHLKPVNAKTQLALRDKDAAAPRKAPHGPALDAAIHDQVHHLAKLQSVFYADGSHALLVVLQGRDAAGKDGTIRHVFSAVNPQGCVVTSFKIPTDLERRHDFLWRVHAAVPARGMIGIFNRSHYEDVLVVRVRKMVPKKVWSSRYAQINDFERMLVENGVVVLKFFLHISRAEQKRRFVERLTDESKNWKFNAADLDDRARWADYTTAYQDMLRECSTPWAPWYVVPADDKNVRNYLIAKTIVDTIEKLKPAYPPADPKVVALATKIV